ncbi:MATE family efflux transporter [Alkaliphilus oremlandii]|uniref:Probable multidrug resistance protein NorM n=1 Tax=Alkaliphilus oremlandii (strain OhILAs) TaxID=350688 RepID=A8MEV1_ALKOO|nr:MATE family efflux transporter [Alkaliphilus oremlandii]ABW18430.1 MATE efflux family protein [Alkaliphilus oremlandii OhILAs]
MDSKKEHTAKNNRIEKWLKDPIRADVIDIAWPVLVELLLSSLFGMVDMIMLGRIADSALAAASMAAVGITNQPLFIGLSLVQALNVGATAMIARYLGSNRRDRIENTLKHVTLLSLVMLAIPISLFGLIFSDAIMTFMGAQADTLQAGSAYFKIVMIGFIFQSLNMSISAALRGIGETKVPMKINIRVNFLNIFGNAVLIYGLFGFPKLGVTGAGLSTTLANAIASVFLLKYIVKGNDVIQLNLKTRFKFDKDIIYNLVKIGVPASIEQLVLRTGVLLFAKIVAGLGTVTYAAHQIALSILGLSFQPGQAFGIAASSLVGRALGTNELDLSEDYAKETRRIGSMISTFMALILFFLGPQLVSLYSSDPEIIKSASLALKIIALVQPFQSSQLILAGGLRGAGDTFWPLLSTFIGVLLIRVALAYVFVNTLGYGLAGAWVAVFVDQFVRWFFVYIRFRTGKWKYTKLR